MKRKDIDIDKLLSQYFKSEREPSQEQMDKAREPILRRIKAAAFDATTPVKPAAALTPIEHRVLTATCLLGAEGYGMVIWQKANESATQPVSISSVYTALDLMEERGLVTSWIDKKRFFKLTAVGERALAEARAGNLATDPADDALGDLA